MFLISNWFRRSNSKTDTFSNIFYDEEELVQEHASALDTFNSHKLQIAQIKKFHHWIQR